MKLPHRRQFLHLAAAVVALPAISRNAWAHAYPSRPVHIIFGLASGSAGDILARLIGQWLSERPHAEPARSAPLGSRTARLSGCHGSGSGGGGYLPPPW